MNHKLLVYIGSGMEGVKQSVERGVFVAFHEESKVALNCLLSYYLLKRPPHWASGGVCAVRNFLLVFRWCQKFQNSF